jgi:hypothetical protein
MDIDQTIASLHYSLSLACSQNLPLLLKNVLPSSTTRTSGSFVSLSYALSSSLFPNLYSSTSNLGSLPIVYSYTWTFGPIIVVIHLLTLNFDSLNNVSSSMCVVDKSILWISQISFGSTLEPRKLMGINSYGFHRSSIFSLILYKIWRERHILSTKVILECL